MLVVRDKEPQLMVMPRRLIATALAMSVVAFGVAVYRSVNVDPSGDIDTALPAETGATTSTTGAGPPVVSGSVQAFDQTSDGTTVSVPKVEILGSSGYVIIHVDDGGPEEVVGHAAIPAGESTDVVVTLDKRVRTGALWAMVHRDAGTVGTFEWPGPDGPVRPMVSGLTYAQRRFVLTVK